MAFTIIILAGLGAYSYLNTSKPVDSVKLQPQTQQATTQNVIR